jgi:hypothetical protein
MLRQRSDNKYRTSTAVLWTRLLPGGTFLSSSALFRQRRSMVSHLESEFINFAFRLRKSSICVSREVREEWREQRSGREIISSRRVSPAPSSPELESKEETRQRQPAAMFNSHTASAAVTCGPASPRVRQDRGCGNRLHSFEPQQLSIFSLERAQCLSPLLPSL